MKHTTVQSIIDAAGGHQFFSEDFDLTYFAVHRWNYRGIPHYFWKTISKRTGIPVEQIKKVSSKAKAKTASRSK